MAGWLHGVFVVDWLFVFPLCGFSLSLFCNYSQMNVLHVHGESNTGQASPRTTIQRTNADECVTTTSAAACKLEPHQNRHDVITALALYHAHLSIHI